jgi:hypothetical protein
MKTIYNDWTIIDWVGNPALKHKCYAKTFGRGTVYVGIGDFDRIVFSYGASSEYSYSSTRWRENGHITEQQAMAAIDKSGGKECKV